MHFRGKSMRLEAIYPNGSSEILASVPGYDFYWQITDRYRDPPLIPAGTTLRVTSRVRQLFEQPPESRSRRDGSLGTQGDR